MNTNMGMKIFVVFLVLQSLVAAEYPADDNNLPVGDMLNNMLRLERAVNNLTWMLKLTKTDLEKTQTDLQTTQLDLENTKRELKTNKLELKNAKTDLQKVETNLQTAKEDLKITKEDLQNLTTDFVTTQAALKSTEDKLESAITGLSSVESLDEKVVNLTTILAMDCNTPTSRPNMTVEVSSSTLYGSTATYSCAEGYSGTGSGTSTCQSDGTWSTPELTCAENVVKIDGWVLLLRATADINRSMYDLWMNDFRYHDHPVLSSTVEPGCLTLMTSLPCTQHFKSKLVTQWSSSNIDLVKQVYLKENRVVAELLFDGRGTNKTSWFSGDRLVNSSWTDLKGAETNYFSIEGHPDNRRFFINHNYGGCPNDQGWTTTIDAYRRTTTWACSWDTQDSFPKFLYSPQPYKSLSLYHDYADAVVILAKLHE